MNPHVVAAKGKLGNLAKASSFVILFLLILSVDARALGGGADVHVVIKTPKLIATDGSFEADYIVYGSAAAKYNIELDTWMVSWKNTDLVTFQPGSHSGPKSYFFQHTGTITGNLKDCLKDGSFNVIAELKVGDPPNQKEDRDSAIVTVKGWNSILSLTVSETYFKAENGTWTFRVNAIFKVDTHYTTVPGSKFTTEFKGRGHDGPKGGWTWWTKYSGVTYFSKNNEASGTYAIPPDPKSGFHWVAIVSVDGVGEIRATRNDGNKAIP